jgi:hypothetical protein
MVNELVENIFLRCLSRFGGTGSEEGSMGGDSVPEDCQHDVNKEVRTTACDCIDADGGD